jgi:hypothetical protein
VAWFRRQSHAAHLSTAPAEPVIFMMLILFSLVN